MKRTLKRAARLLVSACVMIPAMLVSCEKEGVSPDATVSVVADNISITHGESVDIPFSISDMPDGGEINELTVAHDNPDFEITVQADDTGDSGTVSVQAPEIITEACTINVTLTITLTTGDTITCQFQVYGVMGDNFVEFTDPANCYIVTPGAVVKFPANVGNTSEKPEFTTAELVWQDSPALVKAIMATTEDGYIYALLTDGTDGNATIAAKNADEEIVWSWHLWVTDFDPDAKVMEWTNSTSGVTYQIMDRYIGALSDSPDSDLSNGLFYQWGRKDPFGTSNHENSLKPMYDMDGQTVERTFEPCSEENNISNSIANPLTHYTGVNNSAGSYSWISNDATVIVSDEVKDLWGGVSGEKTKYDPCPDGWKVIPEDGYGFYTSTDGVERTVVYDGNGEAYTNMRGRQFTIGGEDFYFPHQGEVTHDGEYANGIGSTWPCGKTWSGTLNDNGYGRGPQPSPSSVYIFYVSTGYELPVRCMKM